MRGTTRGLGFEGFVYALALAGIGLAAGSASAQVVPRHCGMRAGSETYGSIMVGSTVILGRHTPWAGDDNWDPGMDRFVGTAAVVTELSGLDTAGCPGIRVGVDGGQWFWRVRDVQLPMAAPPPPPVAADPVPRYCGMRAGAESYGVLRAGVRVVLGRHTPWAGDDNWAGEMNRYVGSVATITRLDGVDTAGCPGMRVDVDGGTYFWRIRDAQLAAVAPPPPPPPVAIPMWCGMRSGAETYGPLTVGSWVVLGMHSPWNGDTNWTAEMTRFVGQRAMVTQLSGLDTAGCPGVRVNVDGGEFFWRIRDMRM